MHREAIEPTEYTVVPTGAEFAYRWLKVSQKASESAIMPHQDGNLRMPLGHTTHHDGGLLHAVSVSLEYKPGGGYELSAALSNGSCEDQVVMASSAGSPLVAALGLSGGEYGVVSLEGGIRRGRTGRYREDSSLPPLPEVARVLRGELMSGYDVEFSGRHKKLFITTTDASIGNLFTDEEPLTVELIEGKAPMDAYLVKFLQSIEEDPDEFSLRYQATGYVVQQLVRSVFKAKGRYSPAETLEMQPPQGIEAVVKRLEQALEISRRQMSAMGLIDGVDEEDIRKRIILSKDEIPAVTFEDIGGQERAKKELKYVVLGTTNPEVFRSEGTFPPKGVLLYGPKGTGKTLLARAVAAAANATFFNVEIASMIHGLVGKSEKYMQELFRQARQEAPSIIFFDELDSIARSRSVSDRFSSNLVTMLLTSMDGLRDSDDGVTVIGATNFLELVDDALLRPKRFGVRIPVELPDLQARKDVLNIKIREALTRARRPYGDLFDPSFSVDAIADRTDKYSGADLEELVRLSLQIRVQDIIEGRIPRLITTGLMIDQSTDYDRVRQDMNSRLQMGFQAEMNRRNVRN